MSAGSPARSAPRWAGRIAAPATLAAATAVAAVAGSMTIAAPAASATTTASARPAASARTAHSPHGRIHSAWQNSTDHTLHVTGFAYDGGSGQSRKPVRVSIYVNGHYRRTVAADEGSKRYDATRGIAGRHAFSVVMDVPHTARRVRLQVHAAGQHHGTASVDTARVHQRTTKAQRIVRVARRYVGSPYSYGADGPHAFDCSGYSKFVYRKAHIARLPHNSQAQRHAKHMHQISRKHARPGDLVFYLSGNSAYHVSIYAGHGKQYSATDPARGVEHSTISSHDVIFKTDWH